jgi:hypothetical protein
MGPFFVVSHGKSGHSKQRRTPFLKAQVEIWQNLFSLGTHPCSPFGHFPETIRGHFSQAMPQTPIRKPIHSYPDSNDCIQSHAEYFNPTSHSKGQLI